MTLSFIKATAFPTIPHTTEWYASRREGIGGSDLSNLLGGQYACERRLAMDKRGKKEDFPDNDNFRFRRGTRQEPVARQYYRTKYGREVHQDVPTYAARAGARNAYILRTNLDGVVLNENGEPGVLEIKTLGLDNFKRYKREGLPPHYIAQGHWGAGITGLSWISFAIFNPDSDDLYKIDISFDKSAFNALKDKALQFWETYVDDRESELPDFIDDLSTCKKCPFRLSCKGITKSGIDRMKF